MFHFYKEIRREMQMRHTLSMSGNYFGVKGQLRNKKDKG
jgi:hypothetical protein